MTDQSPEDQLDAALSRLEDVLADLGDALFEITQARKARHLEVVPDDVG